MMNGYKEQTVSPASNDVFLARVILTAKNKVEPDFNVLAEEFKISKGGAS